MVCTRIGDNTETTIKIQGALDALTVSEFRAVMNSVMEEGCDHVVVDLSELTLLDGSGVGALVTLFKRIRALGNPYAITFTGARDQPLAALKLLRLDRVFGL